MQAGASRSKQEQAGASRSKQEQATPTSPHQLIQDSSRDARPSWWLGGWLAGWLAGGSHLARVRSEHTQLSTEGPCLGLVSCQDTPRTARPPRSISSRHRAQSERVASGVLTLATVVVDRAQGSEAARTSSVDSRATSGVAPSAEPTAGERPRGGERMPSRGGERGGDVS